VQHLRRRFSAILVFSLASSMLTAQQPTRLTADDYARAERRLAPSTVPLVTGMAGPVAWLPDGRFWYRTSTAARAEFTVVDPVQRTRAQLFDAPRLAAALGAVTGAPLDPARLPL
jgi:hypothetical protein